jgi:hypothetical protein
VNEPSAAQPAEFECVTCNGRGGHCASCGGLGSFSFTCCPFREIDPRMPELMRTVRLTEIMPPVAGGQLDQTKCYLDALDWITTEQRRWKAESGIETHGK